MKNIHVPEGPSICLSSIYDTSPQTLLSLPLEYSLIRTRQVPSSSKGPVPMALGITPTLPSLASKPTTPAGLCDMQRGDNAIS